MNCKGDVLGDPPAVDETPMRIGARFYLLYLLFVLLIFPVHEFGHYCAYRLLGIRVQMTLNTASPRDQSLRKPIAELAGPLVNLGIASAAAVLFRVSGRRRQSLAALALAAAMMRLVIYVLVMVAALVTGSGLTLGNDEPIAAHLWGLPSLTLVVILVFPFAAVVWSVFRSLRASAACKALHLAGFALITFGIGMLIGNVLDPWLFPRR
jgi:hypothetical protein